MGAYQILIFSPFFVWSTLAQLHPLNSRGSYGHNDKADRGDGDEDDAHKLQKHILNAS